MSVSFTRKANASGQKMVAFIGTKAGADASYNLTNSERKALNARPEKWQKFLCIHSDGNTFLRVPTPENKSEQAEHFRVAGAEIWAYLQSVNATQLHIASGSDTDVLAFAEGVALTNYRFEKYKAHPATYHLKQVSLNKTIATPSQLKELDARLRGICFARDLVNEPANVLTAEEFANRIKKSGEEAGFKVEIFDKSRIKALKMGGLLAVNQGSTRKPTFSVMEYKPAKARNKKPVVLVGKGIVYDTGGLSLKPTPNSMDIMKSDMGGGAAVAGAIYAAALAGIPVHLVGLIPATDNQPGPDAYGPGDVITMMDGTRVEVMNTDAEGRLVLADALAYAKKYKPELTIDLATLTGASMRAVGYTAATVMGTADEKIKKQLAEAGRRSHERMVEMPLWSDYASELKSDIADMRNIGTSPLAGAIVAGKFLEHFIDTPWIHLDIAGPAFLPSKRNYLPKGGTGFGVNLLFEFLKDYTK